MLIHSLLLLLVSIPALALDFAALKPVGHVNDFAHVMSAESRTQLERYAAEIERITGVELAFVTLPLLEGEPVEDVANKLFRAWGVGKKGKDEGALLLLAIREHRSRLEIGYGLEPALPDGSVGSILREMRPALRDQHYGDAMLYAAQSIGRRVLAFKNVDPSRGPTPPAPSRVRQRESDFPWTGAAAAVTMLAILLAISGRGRRRRSSWFPIGLTGGGFGWSDSSGSGGGFGGFGGGDSGGGGASSNW